MPIMNLDESRRSVDMVRHRMESQGDSLSKDAEKDILCRTIWARSEVEWAMIAMDVIHEASPRRVPWKGGRDVRGFMHG